MQNFTYQNPTKIIFGQGQIRQLATQIPADARVLLAYGGGSIQRNGIYQQVKAALGERFCVEFAGIEPNPSVETLNQALPLIKSEKLDFILAVGGGSVIDGCKYLAAAACYEGDGWDILSKKVRLTAAIPLGVVLTLPATGTESNPHAVITCKALQQKRSFSHPLVYPTFAVLDPSTTFSLPARQVANGVVDAFVHVMEQYLTYPVDAMVQDRFAESLLSILLELGPKIAQNPDDYSLRANLMWTASMALNGLIGVGVPQDWATHAIGHEITAQYGLDHAQTLAIVLPALLQQQRAVKRQKLLQYASRVWQLHHADEERMIDEAITHTRQFFEQMGVPTRLTDYGLSADAVATLCQQLQAHGVTKLGEHQAILAADIAEILQLAL